MKQNIYRTDQRIDGALRRLEFSDLSDRNVEVLKDFKRELLAEDVSGHRVNAIFQSFNTISHLIDFDLQDASRHQRVINTLYTYLDVTKGINTVVCLETNFRGYDSLNPVFSESICPFKSLVRVPLIQPLKIRSNVSEVFTLGE